MPRQIWQEQIDSILEDFKSGRQDDETTIRRLRARGMTYEDAMERVKDLNADKN